MNDAVASLLCNPQRRLRAHSDHLNEGGQANRRIPHYLDTVRASWMTLQGPAHRPHYPWNLGKWDTGSLRASKH